MLDYFDLQALLSDDQRQLQATVRSFVDREVVPSLEEWWTEGNFPKEIIKALGDIGVLGAKLPAEYGGAALDALSYGLVQYELERADSGLRSFASVTSGLVMHPIMEYGSEEQCKTYLPELAAGRMVGCFGLTEPDGGSDPGAMRTHASRDGSDYVLNGAKMWITNSPIADVAVVWAKDDAGIVRGFLVETDTPGFSAPVIHSKMSMRMSVTGEIVLQECRVPATSMLPGAQGLRAPLSCLTQARYGISWGVMGALETVYQTALDFSAGRSTFGREIGSRQLVQEKLVQMLASHTQGLLMSHRLAELMDAGTLRFAQVSLAKRTNVRAALIGARLAREILGAGGITTEYPVIRHMLNLETVDTYEGTYDVHTLIVGRDASGLDALM